MAELLTAITQKNNNYRPEHCSCSRQLIAAADEPVIEDNGYEITVFPTLIF
jgi:hypothetical protein